MNKRLTGLDWLLLPVVLAGAFILSLWLSRNLSPVFLEKHDLWFGADIIRVVENMTDPGSNYDRTSVHPIFPFLLLPPVKILMSLGVEKLLACRLMVASSAGALVSFLFLTCRSIGCSRRDAILVIAVFCSTASFIFWWSVIETFTMGSATIMLFLMMVGRKHDSKLGWILGGAATLSITLSNWAVAWFALRQGRLLHSIKLLALGFVIVASAAIGQKTLLSSSNLFFLPSVVFEETRYVSTQGLGDVLSKSLNFVLYTGVAPQATLMPDGAVVSGSIADFTTIGILAALAWCSMLVLAAKEIIGSHLRRDILLRTAVLFLSYQMVLHTFYGDEPFLYSAHFLPGFMIIVASGFARAQSCTLSVATASFSILAAISNMHQYHRALAIVAAGP